MIIEITNSYISKYGLPLHVSYSQGFKPQTVVANHSTVIQHPECIKKYLPIETQHRAVMGPCKTPPISGLHCSPVYNNSFNVISNYSSCSCWLISIRKLSASVAFMKQAWSPNVMLAPTACHCNVSKL